MNKQLTYGFIGAGNMSQAIIKGMLNSKQYTPQQIIASTASIQSAEKINETFNIPCSNNNDKCLSADVIILAVKPQIIGDLLSSIPSSLFNQKLIISVIAGKTCDFFKQHTSSQIRIVRTMPNIPSSIGLGMTGLYAENCTHQDIEVADKMMLCTGKTLWVDNEDKINAINAISGSGPAYVYLFAKELARAGTTLGLTEKEALMLSIQTLKGAAHLAEQQHDNTLDSLSSLMDKITSKGGTTHQALETFKNNNFSDIIEQAVNSCYEKAKKLSK